jgi:hypothetical protein
VTLTFDLWPWKSIRFQTLIRTKYVPSLVKIHWRMLILECSQGCYMVKTFTVTLTLDLENQHSRINILQWISTKLGTYLVLKRIWNPIDFQGQRSRSPGQIFTAWYPCEHSRINILQWILTKLGTCLVLRRVWSPIDFQGQR